MSDPEVVFIGEALVLGQGEIELNMIIIREPDGRYRKATGPDLVKIHEAAPGFIRLTQRSKFD